MFIVARGTNMSVDIRGQWAVKMAVNLSVLVHGIESTWATLEILGIWFS